MSGLTILFWFCLTSAVICCVFPPLFWCWVIGFVICYFEPKPPAQMIIEKLITEQDITETIPEESQLPQHKISQEAQVIVEEATTQVQTTQVSSEEPQLQQQENDQEAQEIVEEATTEAQNTQAIVEKQQSLRRESKPSYSKPCNPENGNFRVFGKTYEEFWPSLLFIYHCQLFGQSSHPLNTRKRDMWLTVLRYNERMSSAARRDLTELTERLCKDRKYFHQFPVIDLDFASYIKAHPSPSHTEHWQHFSLKLFEECRGYEFKDVNVNEEGVIISSDLPSAPYQPDQTCSACWELKQAHSFPQRRITSECQHELDLCLECLQEALQGHIDRPDLRDATKLLCPTCSAEMSYEESSQVEQTRVFPEVSRCVI
jgi:hypothetical protein